MESNSLCENELQHQQTDYVFGKLPDSDMARSSNGTTSKCDTNVVAKANSAINVVAIGNQNEVEDELKHLLVQKDAINTRLKQITIQPFKLQPPKKKIVPSQNSLIINVKNPSHQVPICTTALKSKDTHRDYLLKEMQWLATDYSAERRRHLAVGRRISAAIKNYFETKNLRYQKQLTQAEHKRKKLASKISNKIVQTHFWYKLEKVITYKQKVNLQLQRNKAMNLQLKKLVKQTEKYSDSLLTISRNDIDCYVKYDGLDRGRYSEEKEGDSNNVRQETKPIDLESKSKEHMDNAMCEKKTVSRRVRFASSFDFAGEKSHCSGSDESDIETLHSNDEDGDESYVGVDQPDDETTIEHELNLPQELSVHDEIKLLQEENEMSIDELLAKYSRDNNNDNSSRKKDKNVRKDDNNILTNKEDMELTEEPKGDYKYESSVIGLEAFDDETTLEAEEMLGRDMTRKEEIELLEKERSIKSLYQTESSLGENCDEGETDVDDFSDTDQDEDFEPDALEVVDDETTIEAEEKLLRDITYEEEIALLNSEGTMSIDELREKYMPKAVVSDATELEKEASQGASNVDLDNRSTTCSTNEHRVLGCDRNDEKHRDFGKQEHQNSDVVNTRIETISSVEESQDLAKKCHASKPFLLSPWLKMREYQQVGLDWLVTLQSRRLNGILADGKFRKIRPAFILLFHVPALNVSSLYHFSFVFPRDGTRKNSTNYFSDSLPSRK